MHRTLRLQSGRRDILPVCSEPEERQVSSSISNMAGMARRARRMTVSVAPATGSVLDIQYLHSLTGVSYLTGWCARAACVYSPEGVNTQGLDDWLHSTAVCVAENSRRVYNVHLQLLHADLDEKVHIILEALQYSYTY